ncbi:ABC transporter substrate-binding protein [Anaerocolumna xylanovorans]|uniref:Raffinose/stachyose/melibiose transport system substrate-binding protein n=1 Tax=Anaerocolumna xylanovorans DSM 12503 TaxID=1121345 RepID=A0A1M7Y455_9FIRM|nr:extracellular solute-binding protein [Anaerocolumna xylanovorans]SHO46999.1 raffinose/stachyose/melibiose transport system substrate-binding protein [Anaerocolumna xylanovorans DSM 12503]
MKRKKLLSIMLSLVLIIGLLAGCSTSKKDDTQGTTEGTTKEAKAEDPTAADTKKEHVNLKFFTGKIETIDVMNEIINDFNASQDRITVEQEYQKDASNIIKIKFAADQVPDIMTTYEQGFADEDKYLDLSDQSQWWSRLTPAMKDMCTDVDSGKQYRICTNMTMAGIFYNKEIFKELGLEVASNWNDFMANLETIKEKKPDVTPFFIFGNEAWHLGHLIEFIPQGYIKATYGTVEAKKAFLDNDKSKLNFGAPDGALATFAGNLLDMQAKGLINSDVLTATSDNCIQDFANGKAAMFSNGMWCLSSILEANPDMESNIGFAPYPAYMEGSKPVILSAEDSGYSISSTTKYKDEAIEFLNFLYKAENQKKYSEALKSPSAFTDVNASWASEGIVTEVNNALNSAVHIGFTNEKPAGFSGDDAGRMVQELLAGGYSAADFAKAFEEAWDAGMK